MSLPDGVRVCACKDRLDVQWASNPVNADAPTLHLRRAVIPVLCVTCMRAARDLLIIGSNRITPSVLRPEADTHTRTPNSASRRPLVQR